MSRSFWAFAVWLSLPLLAILPAGCSGNGGTPDTGVDSDDGDAGGDPGPQPCATHAQCPLGWICLGVCTPGTPCDDPSDCPAAYTCNMMREVCEPEPCASDTDCQDKPGTPHCLSSSQMCVGCTADNHCVPVEQYCDLTSYQCKGVGPDCTTDADCTSDPSKTHCGPDGKCYGCVVDTHCPGGVCDPSSKHCVQCVAHANCVAPTPRCDPATSTCVGCLSDIDCTGGLRCNTSTKVCTDVLCTADADCANEPGKPKCREATGDCVECEASAECGDYGWCRNYTCASGCTTDAECQEKPTGLNRCNTQTGSCFYAECLSDADCSANPVEKHCKTAASPSNPPQNTCVECTETGHCQAGYECGYTTFVCAPKPCHRYTTNPTPNEKCQQIDPCYFCDLGDGNCKPLATFSGCYDDQSNPCRCTYNASDPYFQGGCCQGYHCTGSETCERNLDCQDNGDCPTDSTCNTTYFQCEHVSCCNPECGAGAFCNSSCVCESGCHEEGEVCDPAAQNCCEGLSCNFMWPFCFAV